MIIKKLNLKSVKVFLVDLKDLCLKKELIKPSYLINVIVNYVLVKTNLSLKDTINLARIYYILGNEKVPERLLNEVIFDSLLRNNTNNFSVSEGERNYYINKAKQELGSENNIINENITFAYDLEKNQKTAIVELEVESINNSSIVKNFIYNF